MTERQKVYLSFLCRELKKDFPTVKMSVEETSSLISEYEFFYNGSDEELAEKYKAYKHRFFLEESGPAELEFILEEFNDMVGEYGIAPLSFEEFYTILAGTGGREPDEGSISFAQRLADWVRDSRPDLVAKHLK